MGSALAEATPPLRRRNSIAAAPMPARLDLPAKTQSSSLAARQFPAVDFELVSLNSRAYTSLRDLMPLTPGGVPSPKGVACQSCRDISIRNHLVKQAAWAYLQPMSSADAAGPDFFRRMWERSVGVCLAFVNRHLIPIISGAISRLLAVFAFRRDGKRRR